MNKKLSVWICAALILSASAVNASPGHHHNGPRHQGLLNHSPLKHLPAKAISVVLAGVTYWVVGETFYRKQGKTYVSVVTPVGAKVRFLPHGAVVVKRQGKPYFYHAGVYYRWLPKAKRYEVVQLKVEKGRYQLGQVLQTLPNGADAVLFKGVQYFRYQGQYFIAAQRSGKPVYVVVDIAPDNA